MRPISNISRRSALRGLGADSLLISGVLRSVRAEAAPTNTRVVFIFHANGPHHAWTPTGSGEAFTLTPQLAPLEPVRRDVAILRGLTLARGGGNPHRAATFSALGAGAPTSLDQVLARATFATCVRNVRRELNVEKVSRMS